MPSRAERPPHDGVQTPGAVEGSNKDEWWPAEAFPKMGEFGLFGVAVPETYGGLGLDQVSSGAIVQALGRWNHALALCWVRALGEFGIVLIIAYFPAGMPVRLWIDVQDLGIEAVFPLVAVFLMATLPVPLWLGLRARRSPA